MSVLNGDAGRLLSLKRFASSVLFYAYRTETGDFTVGKNTTNLLFFTTVRKFLIKLKIPSLSIVFVDATWVYGENKSGLKTDSLWLITFFATHSAKSYLK